MHFKVQVITSFEQFVDVTKETYFGIVNLNILMHTPGLFLNYSWLLIINGYSKGEKRFVFVIFNQI